MNVIKRYENGILIDHEIDGVDQVIKQPLIQSFTKNLSGCSGCGQLPEIKKGEKVTFNVTVQVEAENGKEAANKIPDSAGIVVGVAMKPPQNVGATQFQRSTTQAIPAK